MAARKPLVTVDGVTQEMASGDAVSVGRGGTELTSYSVGDLIYASGSTALSKLAAAAAGNVLRSGTSPSWGKVTSSYVDSSISVTGHTHAHSSITGLTSGDDHTQYALLAGRSGGQTLVGGTASGNSLTLQSTSHATRGVVTTVVGDALYVQDNGSTGAPCLQIGDSATGFWFVPVGSLLVATTGGVDRLVISASGISSSVSYISPVLDAPALGTPVSGVLTNCTGTAAGLTAGNVTTNANLTGPITSVGNATSVASQTGTGTTFVMDNSPTLVTPTLGVASATSLTISGNQSAAAWTTGGIRLVGTSGTLTDTTSSGTVATAYTNKLGGNTIAASSPTTFTNYVSSYFTDPVAGTNVTLTNKWSLGGDSLRIGTSNHFTITTAGAVSAFSLACPTFTSSAAMGFTPAAGSGFNITLSGAGDFLINSTQFVVDVSTGRVGVGGIPSELFHTQSAGNTWIHGSTSGSTHVAGGYFITPTTELDFASYGGYSVTRFGQDTSGMNSLLALVGGLFVGTVASANVVIGTNNTAAITIDTSQNVGIGATPNYKLTISNSNGNYFASALLSSSIGTPGNWVGQLYGYTGNTYQKAATIFESSDAYGRGKFHIALNSIVNSSNVTVSDARVTVDYTGNVGVAITVPTALLHLGASTTARASLCIPSGTAPTSPVNGDIWSDGSNLLVRLGGTTYTLTKA